MYFYRIQGWKLEKKVRATDAIAVDQGTYREVTGDEGHKVFRAADREIPVTKIERYRRRSRKYQAILQRRSHQQVALHAYKPAVLRTLSAENDSHRAENIGLLLRGYISGSFEAGTWVIRPGRDGFDGTKLGGHSEFSCVAWFRTFCDGIKMLGIYSSRLSGRAFNKLNESLDILKESLAGEHPRLLVCIWQTFAYGVLYGREDIFCKLLEHVRHFGTLVLGQKHPIIQFSEQFLALSPSARVATTTIAVAVWSQELTKVLWTRNPEAFFLLSDDISYIFDSLGLLDNEVQLYQSIMKFQELSAFPDIWINYQIRLAVALSFQGDIDEAVAIFKDVEPKLAQVVSYRSHAIADAAACAYNCGWLEKSKSLYWQALTEGKAERGVGANLLDLLGILVRYFQDENAMCELEEIICSLQS